MKYLPTYWAIKIDKEHPLWGKFVTELKTNYDNFRTGVFEEWEYVLKDEKNNKLNFGKYPSSSIKNDLELLTLEQFFGETQYEIY